MSEGAVGTTELGTLVGTTVGKTDGSVVGAAVGKTDGSVVGAATGEELGAVDGVSTTVTVQFLAFTPSHDKDHRETLLDGASQGAADAPNVAVPQHATSPAAFTAANELVVENTAT